MMSRLRAFSRNRLICQQAVELVTDYLEGALSLAGRRRFEKHLARCPHCTEYLAQMRATLSLTGRIAAEDLPGRMRADLIALYLAWRDGADGHASDQ